MSRIGWLALAAGLLIGADEPKPDAAAKELEALQGTWTMVVTNDAGMSCVLAAGEAWDEMPTHVAGRSS